MSRRPGCRFRVATSVEYLALGPLHMPQPEIKNCFTLLVKFFCEVPVERVQRCVHRWRQVQEVSYFYAISVEINVSE